MKDVQESGFLGDYSMLKPGGKDRAALVYIKPNANFKQYEKIMFDRVSVWLSPEAKTRGIDPAVLKEMTDYMQKAMINAVKDDYQIVDQPGPEVLRVRVAITDLKPSNPVSNTLSTVLPVGWVISGATKVATDENMGTGEAGAEMEVLDSMSGERLGAAVDRRQGGKGAFRGKWDDTKDAIDYWSKLFSERLEELKNK